MNDQLDETYEICTHCKGTGKRKTKTNPKVYPPLTPFQREYLIHMMHRWREQAEHWSKAYDDVFTAGETELLKLDLLADYFLIAAGSVYLHALELEKDNQQLDKPDLNRLNLSDAMKALTDKRDHAIHGHLRRFDERSNRFKRVTWDKGEWFKAVAEQHHQSIIRSHEVTDDLAPPIIDMVPGPTVQTLKYQTGEEIGPWQRERLLEMDALINLVTQGPMEKA